MKKVIILSICLVFVVTAFAQDADILGGLYKKSHVPAREDIKYHSFREADAMWTKIVWRKLDLREKINHPLYFPQISAFSIEEVFEPRDDRYNITTLLLYKYIGTNALNAVNYFKNRWPDIYSGDPKIIRLVHILEREIDNVSKDISPAGDSKNLDDYLKYMVFEDHEFRKPKYFMDMYKGAGGYKDSILQTDQYGNPIITQFGTYAYSEPFYTGVRPDSITELLMKEIWYFDKNRGKMEVRIVSICPRRVVWDPQGNAYSGTEVGWFYFPAIRPTLASHEVFNTSNDAERRTFDDIFWKRHFSSFVYAETNVFDNRMIREYKAGLDALLEAERVKDWMFKIEHDIWNY
ncbi:MAG: gliding motility protein GldN [Bacteroidales bacterium]|nr:gliding motility protein GldN [Bacteroidales bacterium]